MNKVTIIVEILLEIYSYTRLLQTLVLVKTVYGVGEALESQHTRTVDKPSHIGLAREV